jgi:hypothetical protein
MTVCRSSLTQTTTASETLARPSAARCRVPWRGSPVSAASGRMAPALATRSLPINTAPSCRGAVEVNTASMSADERCASMGVPPLMYSPTQSRRGMTTRAPLPAAASVKAASAMTADGPTGHCRGASCDPAHRADAAEPAPDLALKHHHQNHGRDRADRREQIGRQDQSRSDSKPRSPREGSPCRRRSGPRWFAASTNRPTRTWP